MNGNDMKNEKNAKLILDYVQDEDIYSDGNVENEILDIFKGKNSEQKVREILNNNPSWAMRYHLSPVRGNLLSWFDFNPSSSLLEVGAGCGAVTGIFCDKLKSVVAIELSKRRAEIVINRHKNSKNLTVYAGNLNDIKLNEKFDYITLIGVLEYAGKFTHTKDPFVDFLKNVRKNLKKNGTIIIAIENRFGLKYWSGVKEDHTGRLFDSIENYPNKEGIETFGKEEIKNILKKAGFQENYFYYPMPDYKLPIEIFSDLYLPTKNHNISSGMFPFQDFLNSRDFLFNEKLAMDSIIKNNQFDFFANSFLIFAK